MFFSNPGATKGNAATVGWFTWKLWTWVVFCGAGVFEPLAFVSNDCFSSDGLLLKNKLSIKTIALLSKIYTQHLISAVHGFFWIINLKPCWHYVYFLSSYLSVETGWVPVSSAHDFSWTPLVFGVDSLLRSSAFLL